MTHEFPVSQMMALMMTTWNYWTDPSEVSAVSCFHAELPIQIWNFRTCWLILTAAKKSVTYILHFYHYHFTARPMKSAKIPFLLLFDKKLRINVNKLTRKVRTTEVECLCTSRFVFVCITVLFSSSFWIWRFSDVISCFMM